MATADRWVDAVDAAFLTLASHPMLGRARPELAVGPRSFPFKRYVIFHLPLRDGIDLVRVLHSARDIYGLVGGNP